MEGERKNSPVFHSDDIKSSKANSDKEYFVNVIDDPFQQWLLRKKPAKVKVKQDFETPVAPPEKPEEKPKPPQCRTTIRLTTERLRRDSSKFRGAIIFLSITTGIFLLASIGLSLFFLIAPKETVTKTETVYVPTEPTYSPEEKELLCAYYSELLVSAEDANNPSLEKEYTEKVSEFCPEDESKEKPEEKPEPEEPENPEEPNEPENPEGPEEPENPEEPEEPEGPESPEEPARGGGGEINA